MPATPLGFSAVVSGRVVGLAWTGAAGVAPTGFELEAGLAPGRVDLGPVPVAGSPIVVTGVPGT